MSGHSKWSNIKRKKEKTESQRAKIFTKIGREIAVAVKSGGPDPAANSKLKDVIAKAKQNNVPNDNIERIIKRAAGDGANDSYEDIVYEGYGPGGIAVVVQCLTDNRNRTAGDLRHYFDKCGGSLGQTGSVMFMFDKKGVIDIEISEDGTPGEDEVMECALDAGALDFSVENEAYEILTEPNDLSRVKDEIESRGYMAAYSEVDYLPMTYTAPADDDVKAKMEKLIDLLEDNDDVQKVWHNMEESEQE